jgi:hypothetical protein
MRHHVNNLTPGSECNPTGGHGDGAGIMFADGLYRNALRMLGTPRAPTATADDGRGLSLAHNRPRIISLISAVLKPLYYH